jgi:hypothetical protein
VPLLSDEERLAKVGKGWQDPGKTVNECQEDISDPQFKSLNGLLIREKSKQAANN